MKIVFQKDKVSYSNLVKMLLIGHAVGWGVLMLPILFLAWFTALANEGGSPSHHYLLVAIFAPIVLIAQTLILALLYRLGFWVYGLVRPIQIEVRE